MFRGKSQFLWLRAGLDEALHLQQQEANRLRAELAARNEENADLCLLVSDLKVEASEAREQNTLSSKALKERSSELDKLRAEKEVMRTALVEASNTIGTLTENGPSLVKR